MIYRNPPSQLKLTVHRHRDRARQRWFACNPVSNLSIDTQREKKKKARHLPESGTNLVTL